MVGLFIEMTVNCLSREMLSALRYIFEVAGAENFNNYEMSGCFSSPPTNYISSWCDCIYFY